MILDNLKETRENILEKVRSPFGGTFIVTWTIHNWRLVYSIFNFDPGTKLNDKLIVISSYLKIGGRIDWNKLIISPVLYALLAIVAYLLLSNLSLLIFNLSSKWVKPLVYWLTDRNGLVLKSSHEQLKRAFKNLQKEKNAAEENLSNVYEEKKNIEKDVAEIGSEYASLKKDHKFIADELKEKKEEISKLNTLINQYSGTSNKIKILAATYGEDKNIKDVTSIIKELVSKGNYQIKVTNAILGGDPSPGQQKRINVTYEIDGEMGTIATNEDGILKFDKLLHESDQT